MAKKVMQVIEENGRYVSYYNGERLTSSSKIRHAEIILNEGGNAKMKNLKLTAKNTDVEYIDCSPEELAEQVSGVEEQKDTGAIKSFDFGINERFEIMSQLIRLITNRQIPSLLITGDGGLGKSHTVMEGIAEARLKNCDDFAGLNGEMIEEFTTVQKRTKKSSDDGEFAWDDDDIDEGLTPKINLKGDYHVIKGYSTPRGLYEALYLYHDKVVIFDDCDSILRDPNALNILKGALDSYDQRVVTWNSSLGRSVGKIKNRFEFTGQIIFISNMHKSTLDNAVRSRCQNVDVSMTREEKVERMSYILPNMNQFETSVKKKALNFIREHLEYIPDRNLNLRTLISVAKLVNNSNDDSWVRVAQYTVQD